MFPLLLVFTLALTPTTSQFVSFGDSITSGVGASDYSHSFIGLLQNDVGYINNQGSGVRVWITYGKLLTYTGMEQNVIWLSGYNDMRSFTTPETYRYYLDKSLEILAASGRRVYLGNCLRMTPEGYKKYAYGPARTEGDARVDQFNQIQWELAAKYPNVIVVSMAGYDPANNADGFHPNDAGYDQIYEAFAAAMRGGTERVWLPVVWE